MIRRPPRSTLFPYTTSSDLTRAILAQRGDLVIVCGGRATLGVDAATARGRLLADRDRESTRLNSSHLVISYAVFCLKKKNGGQVEQGLVAEIAAVLNIVEIH